MSDYKPRTKTKELSLKLKDGKEITLFLLQILRKENYFDYLPVAERLVWFTQDVKHYDINSNFLHLDPKSFAICQTTIKILDENGKVIRMVTATKKEDSAGFPDFIEKSETGAVGRALAMLGYGTQFTDLDFFEGERLADAPVAKKEKTKIDGAINTVEEFKHLESNIVEMITQKQIDLLLKNGYDLESIKNLSRIEARKLCLPFIPKK